MSETNRLPHFLPELTRPQKSQTRTEVVGLSASQKPPAALQLLRKRLSVTSGPGSLRTLDICRSGQATSPTARESSPHRKQKPTVVFRAFPSLPPQYSRLDISILFSDGVELVLS